MDAAERRRREERKRAKVRGYTILWGRTDAETISKLARTHKPCSCYLCGNPRKWMKGKDRLTLQERRAREGD